MDKAFNNWENDFDKINDDMIFGIVEFLNKPTSDYIKLERNDPLELAQQFQHTVESVSDAETALEIGTYGAQKLNRVVPTRMLANRLALVTETLYALSDWEDDGKHSVQADCNITVSGLFDRFSFNAHDDRPHQDISLELIRPRFLAPRIDRQIRLPHVSRLSIPVSAVLARMYEPNI